ncbi:hypothetical protein [Defluviimonas salinarum]|uniref:ParB/Sulfiredoxin domain-containing protein n=1 Tax=Defluviimonas salinarum TaxID=2992147 RepID=A0ABT3J5M8_9RHOB|nr:hypothetical protein [Defluviimonas salinarum]MCW3782983.1 hypothetical protein [Defluviimonas salinarum]
MSSQGDIAQKGRTKSKRSGTGKSISETSAEVTFAVEDITPERASELLERARNAVADKKAVETYAQAMKNGAWILNGQPIILDQDGRVIDGVQRLNACIKADTPFQTIIARNVRSDTLHTIDQHRRRSYQGVLESRGIKVAGAIVRTMSKLIRIENGTLGRENLPISWSRYDRVLAANPELLDAIEIADESRGSALHSTARPVLAFMAIRAGKRDELMAFLRELSIEHTLGLDSPPRVLAQQLILGRQQDNPYGVDGALAVSILAFNDFAAGKKATSFYYWKPDLGDTPLNDDGSPLSRKAIREHAPANLGLPVMNGFPGLREGRFDISAPVDEFGGRTSEEIAEAARTDAGKEQVRMVVLTPERAREWLQFNTGNRKIQPTHVETIARDIEKGHWMVNAQPICFTADPENPSGEEPVRLLNGQHRLRACIMSGIPIEVPIAINIPEEAFATFDTHAKRTMRRMGDRVDDRVLAAAAKFQWKQDNGLPLTGRGSPSATEILQTLDEHPGLASGFSRSRRKEMTKLGSAGVMTYFIYRVMSEQAEWAEEFLDGIETGADVPRGSPILSLRNMAINRRGELSRKDTLDMLIDHWNAFKVWKRKQIAMAEEDDQPSML